MRISDWSSDVCSYDLDILHPERIGAAFDDIQLVHQCACLLSGRGVSSARPRVAAMAALASAPSASSQNTFFMRPPLPFLDRKSTRSELQSLMRISYAVFCLKKKKQHIKQTNTRTKYDNI